MVLVDTSVWSLALRRSTEHPQREVALLTRWIEKQADLCLTGTILQETLQGFRNHQQANELECALRAFPLLQLDRKDYIFAAQIFDTCRANGIQIGTIDAQIAAAAIHHRCKLLTTDKDFTWVASLFPLHMA